MGANIPNLKQNLPMSMTMAAFAGISWYIGIEVNVSLLPLFKTRRGLYFWSCALCSWGVVLQPLFIVLADFGVWENHRASVVMIYLTWMIMVVPQSWVLYSRLHLIMRNKEHVLRWVFMILLFNSTVFTVPTLALGILAQTSTTNPSLPSINRVWDRLQTTVFFAQETALSMLYIWQTQHFLRDASLLQRSFDAQHPAQGNRTRKSRSVLWELIYVNVIVIMLDIALLGIQYADLFYLQGAFKPCVYGVKLKAEFVVLNRLTKSVGSRRASAPRTNSTGQTGGHSSEQTTLRGSSHSKKDSWWGKRNALTGSAFAEEGRSNGQGEVELGRLDGNAMRGVGDGYSFERQDSQTPVITK